MSLAQNGTNPQWRFLMCLALFVLDNDGYFLSGGDVVVGLDFEGRRQGVEVPFQFTR